MLCVGALCIVSSLSVSSAPGAATLLGVERSLSGVLPRLFCRSVRRSMWSIGDLDGVATRLAIGSTVGDDRAGGSLICFPVAPLRSAGAGRDGLADGTRERLRARAGPSINSTVSFVDRRGDVSVSNGCVTVPGADGIAAVRVEDVAMVMPLDEAALLDAFMAAMAAGCCCCGCIHVVDIHGPCIEKECAGATADLAGQTDVKTGATATESFAMLGRRVLTVGPLAGVDVV